MMVRVYMKFVQTLSIIRYCICNLAMTSSSDRGCHLKLVSSFERSL